MENHARYGQMIYAHSADRLLVNLFIPSSVSWEDQNTTVTQSTDFPNAPRTQLRINTKTPRRFTLSIRHPSWVGSIATCALRSTNRPVTNASNTDQYVDINREWKDGDVVSVELPMALHSEMLPHSSAYVSILYGPIVLAGELGRAGLLDSDFHGQMMSEKKAEPARGHPGHRCIRYRHRTPSGAHQRKSVAF